MVGFKEVLRYLKGRAEVTISELQKHFDSDQLTISEIVEKLVAKGALKPKSGETYSVLPGEEECDPDGYECDGGNGNENEADVGEESDAPVASEESEEDASEESEADDASDENGGEGEERPMNPDDILRNVFSKNIRKDPRRKEIRFPFDPVEVTSASQIRPMPEFNDLLGAIGNALPVSLSNDALYVAPVGLELCGARVRFQILSRDGELYLTDGGLAMSLLGQRVSHTAGVVSDRIGAIVRNCGVISKGNELRVKYEDRTKAASYVFRLFAAMVGVANIQTDDDAVSAEDVLLNDETMNDAWIIVETLSPFHIKAKLRGVAVGPTVTRYEFYVGESIAPLQVIKRRQEIAGRLRQRNGVRVYPAADNGCVYIEVPLPPEKRREVSAKKILGKHDMQGWRENELSFAIGEDVDGNPVCGDFTHLRHILVGGAGGSGKTEFLHTMIYSLVTRYSPDEVRLVLCAFQSMEFNMYRELPHLFAGHVITHPQELDYTLVQMRVEMERRYSLFEEAGAGGKIWNLDAYNAACKEKKDRLPRIVIIIDKYEEFAEIFRSGLEEMVKRLSQKSRAAGIYIVLASRGFLPQVIVSSVISDFPTRISFRTNLESESSVLLDETSAVFLTGAGDMLMRRETDSHCIRIQSAHIPHHELIAVLGKIAKSYRVGSDGEAAASDAQGGKGNASDHGDVPDDPLCLVALALAVKTGVASISFIQRKCSVGYHHAGKIIDWMEKMGYVTPFNEEIKKRTVLMTEKQYVEKYGPLD